MLILLLKIYLWIAVFTAVSILLEWRFTGSKSDYRYMRDRLRTLFGDDRRKRIFAFLFLLLLGSILWWVTYCQRIRDVINEVRS